MGKPISRRHLDILIRRETESEAEYVAVRTVLANSIVGHLLPEGVIKGGSSLKIRYWCEPTRATTDFDVARFGDKDLFLHELRASLANGWEGFTGRLVERQPPTPEGVPVEYVMIPFDIKLNYLGAPWCTVRFEMGNDEIESAGAPDYFEPIVANGLLEKLGFPKLNVLPLLPLHFQIAQKLHALSSPNSERAHDLIDLQIISLNSEIDLPLTLATCQRLFSYRKQQAWPPVVVASQAWEELYRSQLLPPPVKQTLDEAIEWVNLFIAKIVNSGF